ncbi:hypothetical protein Q3O60_05270 [Alkalimonas collagenimarina]|uniref:Uncharacterized protein n=1 Tax=Alkalimonas collagenimarina TaxID=400390 RepID=A0ABT9GX11_9GAMM|nr:hypothetical protein [Alkalimonas collagenimarina]MDP4535589.1 hypothetical protein [Alkalimonas collagenimarina]
MDKFYRKELYKLKIHRMANTLMLGFSINSDNSLVLALGHGNEKNNFEAMVHWIERIIDERELSPEDLCITVFVPLLQRDLHDWIFSRYEF